MDPVSSALTAQLRLQIEQLEHDTLSYADFMQQRPAVKDDPDPLQSADFDAAVARAAAFAAQDIHPSVERPHLRLLQQSSTGAATDLVDAALTNSRWLLDLIAKLSPAAATKGPHTMERDLRAKLESQAMLTRELESEVAEKAATADVMVQDAAAIDEALGQAQMALERASAENRELADQVDALTSERDTHKQRIVLLEAKLAEQGRQGSTVLHAGAMQLEAQKSAFEAQKQQHAIEKQALVQQLTALKSVAESNGLSLVEQRVLCEERAQEVSQLHTKMRELREEKSKKQVMADARSSDAMQALHKQITQLQNQLSLEQAAHMHTFEQMEAQQRKRHNANASESKVAKTNLTEQCKQLTASPQAAGKASSSPVSPARSSRKSQDGTPEPHRVRKLQARIDNLLDQPASPTTPSEQSRQASPLKSSQKRPSSRSSTQQVSSRSPTRPILSPLQTPDSITSPTNERIAALYSRIGRALEVVAPNTPSASSETGATTTGATTTGTVQPGKHRQACRVNSPPELASADDRIAALYDRIGKALDDEHKKK